MPIFADKNCQQPPRTCRGVPTNPSWLPCSLPITEQEFLEWHTENVTNGTLCGVSWNNNHVLYTTSKGCVLHSNGLYYKLHYVEYKYQNLDLVPIEIQVKEVVNKRDLVVQRTQKRSQEHTCLLGLLQVGVQGSCKWCSWIPAHVMYLCDEFRYFAPISDGKHDHLLHAYCSLYLEDIKIIEHLVGTGKYLYRDAYITHCRNVQLQEMREPNPDWYSWKPTKTQDCKLISPDWRLYTDVIAGITGLLESNHQSMMFEVEQLVPSSKLHGLSNVNLDGYNLVLKSRTKAAKLNRTPVAHVIHEGMSGDIILHAYTKSVRRCVKPHEMAGLQPSNETGPPLRAFKALYELREFNDGLLGSLHKRPHLRKMYPLGQGGFKPPDVTREHWVNYHCKTSSHHPESVKDSDQMTFNGSLECLCDLFAHALVQAKTGSATVKGALQMMYVWLTGSSNGVMLLPKFEKLQASALAYFVGQLSNKGFCHHIHASWRDCTSWRYVELSDPEIRTLERIMVYGSFKDNYNLTRSMPGWQSAVDETVTHIYLVEHIYRAMTGLDIKHDRDKLCVNYIAWQMRYFGNIKKEPWPELQMQTNESREQRPNNRQRVLYRKKYQPTDGVADILATKLGYKRTLIPIIYKSKRLMLASSLPYRESFKETDDTTYICEPPKCTEFVVGMDPLRHDIKYQDLKNTLTDKIFEECVEITPEQRVHLLRNKFLQMDRIMLERASKILNTPLKTGEDCISYLIRLDREVGKGAIDHLLLLHAQTLGFYGDDHDQCKRTKIRICWCNEIQLADVFNHTYQQMSHLWMYSHGIQRTIYNYEEIACLISEFRFRREHTCTICESLLQLICKMDNDGIIALVMPFAGKQCLADNHLSCYAKRSWWNWRSEYIRSYTGDPSGGVYVVCGNDKVVTIKEGHFTNGPYTIEDFKHPFLDMCHKHNVPVVAHLGLSGGIKNIWFHSNSVLQQFEYIKVYHNYHQMYEKNPLLSFMMVEGVCCLDGAFPPVSIDSLSCCYTDMYARVNVGQNILPMYGEITFGSLMYDRTAQVFGDTIPPFVDLHSYARLRFNVLNEVTPTERCFYQINMPIGRYFRLNRVLFKHTVLKSTVDQKTIVVAGGRVFHLPRSTITLDTNLLATLVRYDFTHFEHLNHDRFAYWHGVLLNHRHGLPSDKFPGEVETNDYVSLDHLFGKMESLVLTGNDDEEKPGIFGRVLGAVARPVTDSLANSAMSNSLVVGISSDLTGMVNNVGHCANVLTDALHNIQESVNQNKPIQSAVELNDAIKVLVDILCEVLTAEKLTELMTLLKDANISTIESMKDLHELKGIVRILLNFVIDNRDKITQGLKGLYYTGHNLGRLADSTEAIDKTVLNTFLYCLQGMTGFGGDVLQKIGVQTFVASVNNTAMILDVAGLLAKDIATVPENARRGAVQSVPKTIGNISYLVEDLVREQTVGATTDAVKIGTQMMADVVESGVIGEMSGLISEVNTQAVMGNVESILRKGNITVEKLNTILKTAEKDNLISKVEDAAEGVSTLFGTLNNVISELKTYIISAKDWVLNMIEQVFGGVVPKMTGEPDTNVMITAALILVIFATSGTLTRCAALAALLVHAKVGDRVKKWWSNTTTWFTLKRTKSEEEKLQELQTELEGAIESGESLLTTSWFEGVSMAEAIMNIFTKSWLTWAIAVPTFVLALCGVMVPVVDYLRTGQTFVQSCRNIYFVESGFKSLTNLWTHFRSFVIWLVDAVSSMAGFPEAIPDKTLRETVVKWLEVLMRFNTPSGKSLLLHDPDAVVAVEDLELQGIAIQRRLEEMPDCPQKSQLTSMMCHHMEQYYTLRDIILANDICRSSRAPPFHVSFYGDSGIGKSHMQTQVINDLGVTLYGGQVAPYVHPSGDNFMEQYHGQKIVVMDDLGQVREGGDIPLLITLCSAFPAITPKADLHAKGMVPFKAEFIISSTNTAYPLGSELCGIVHREAFLRRRNLLVEVVCPNEQLNEEQIVPVYGFEQPRQIDCVAYKFIEYADASNVVDKDKPLITLKQQGSISAQALRKCYPNTDIHKSYPWLRFNILDPVKEEDNLLLAGLTYPELMAFIIRRSKFDSSTYNTHRGSLIFQAKEIEEVQKSVEYLAEISLRPQPWHFTRGLVNAWHTLITGGVVQKEIHPVITSLQEAKYDIKEYDKYRNLTVQGSMEYANDKLTVLQDPKKYSCHKIKFISGEDGGPTIPQGIPLFNQCIIKGSTFSFTTTFLERLRVSMNGLEVKWLDARGLKMRPIYWLIRDIEDSEDVKKQLDMESFAFHRLDPIVQVNMIMMWRLAVKHIEKYPLSIKPIEKPTRWQQFLSYTGQTVLWLLVGLGVAFAARCMVNSICSLAGVPTLDEYAKKIAQMCCTACRARLPAVHGAFTAVLTSREVLKAQHVPPKPPLITNLRPTKMDIEDIRDIHGHVFPTEHDYIQPIPHELNGKMKSNMRLAIMDPFSRGGGSSYTQMWSYGGHMWCVNWHAVEKFMKDKYEDVVLCIFDVRAKEPEVVRVLKNRIHRVGANRDIVLMYLPTIKPASDVLKHLITEKDLENMATGKAQIPTDLLGFVVREDAAASLMNIPLKTNSQFICTNVSQSDASWCEAKAVLVYGEWKRGNSGGVVVAQDKHLRHKIMGNFVAIPTDMHKIDKNMRYGYLSVVTYEDYIQWCNDYQECNDDLLPNVYQEGPLVDGNCYDLTSRFEGAIADCGDVPERFVVPQGGKEEIFPLLEAQYYFGESERVPSITHKNDYRCPADHEPLQHSVNKCGTDKVPQFDEKEVSRVVEGVYGYLRQSISNSHQFQVLDLAHSIKGRDAPGYRSMNVKTSPGLPHVLCKHKPGKKDLFIYNEDTDELYISDECRIMYDSTMESLYLGRVPKHSWYDIPKKELRTKDKLYKTRSISVCDCILTLCFRSLFGDMTAALHNIARGDNQFCVGMNPHSQDMTRMWQSIHAYNIKGLDADVRNYDGHMPPEMLYGVVEIVNKFYNVALDSPSSKARTAIMQNALFGYVQWGSKLYQKPRGMPSGFAGTAEMNTIVHMMLLYYGYRQYCKQHNLCKEISYTNYDRNLCIRVYGDDVIIVPHRDFDIQVEDIVDIYAQMGYPVTSSSKNEQIKFRPVQEVTFLKRFMRPIPGTPLIVGVLDPEVVLDMVRFVRRTKAGKAQMYEDACIAAENMALWGPKVFEWFIDLENKILSFYHQPLINWSYDDIISILCARYFE